MTHDLHQILTSTAVGCKPDGRSDPWYSRTLPERLKGVLASGSSNAHIYAHIPTESGSYRFAGITLHIFRDLFPVVQIGVDIDDV